MRGRGRERERQREREGEGQTGEREGEGEGEGGETKGERARDLFAVGLIPSVAPGKELPSLVAGE